MGIFEGELLWLEPYYEKVKRKIKNKKLTRCYSVPIQQDKISRFLGKCSTTNHRSYEICLYVEYWELTKLKPLKRIRKPLSMIDILHNFAHELAHMVHWDHTPDRLKLECQIASIFMTQLKKEGYISEEDELP